MTTEYSSVAAIFIGHALHSVFKATVQARLLYTVPQLGQVTVLLATATVWSRFCGAASDWVTVTLTLSQ